MFTCAETMTFSWNNFICEHNQLMLPFNAIWFKACVCFFYQIFIFSPNSPSKTMKNAFYFIKKAFLVLKIIKFPSFTFFLPVGHCFRGWSKINLKVYDAISCLNKNSIAHLVWYLEKEKRYDTETLSIDGVSNKEHFYGKIMQKIWNKS